MAELKDRLRADLNAAMRARDQVRMRTLRMALTSITNEEVAGTAARDLTDEEVVKVLTREAKKRREAAEAFSAANRADQAAAERAEGEVLAGYLPAQLSDDDLAKIQRRRAFPTRLTQRVQALIQKRIAGRGLGNPGPTRLPWLLRLMERTTLPRRLRNRVIPVGIRPEHVKTPDVLNAA